MTRLYADALGGAPAVMALAGATAGGGLMFLLVLLLVDRPLIRSAVAQGARILGRGSDPAPAS